MFGGILHHKAPQKCFRPRHKTIELHLTSAVKRRPRHKAIELHLMSAVKRDQMFAFKHVSKHKDFYNTKIMKNK